ncbi:glucose-6-phosphate isomerase [Buchnera aphidicola]|uniref:glucose-6-phosphate isomerase n=1 Tax=Buchnera aphidicola TaxID=9 RepID=UPI00346433F1
MKNINPVETIAWKELKNHYKIIKNMHISDLFLKDNQRFKKFSLCFNDEILVDFSKNLITDETILKLLNLVKEINLYSAIKAMFQGDKINRTENRAVLHIALRNKINCPIMLDGKNIMLDINFILKKMKNFSEKIINGDWKGCTGKKITDIVNIGIGGSDLGPRMVTESLRPYKNHLNMHYVSNIDGIEISEVLKKISYDTTLFIIISKTFTTQETMTNAYTARNWFLKFTTDKNNIRQHFVAVSTNTEKVINFGIHAKNVFTFWDWVGGRYSLWSSVGLSIVLSIGFKNFSKLLKGAYDMDMHFYQTPFDKNIPVLLALIGIWYNNFFCAETEAIFPYDQNMHLFPAYLQQGNMESNGKNIDRNGENISYQTGPIIWGTPGTNGQHAFYQLIYQGTKLIPCDFIAPIISHHMLHDHHEKLLSNFFAQTKTLAFGNIAKNIQKNDEKFSNVDLKESTHMFQYKNIKGNIPTNSILLRKITPYTLGVLIAMYEHKIFTQGIIFNIFSFDQWGVELGKKVADKILYDLKKNKKNINYDISTNGLINFYNIWINKNQKRN